MSSINGIGAMIFSNPASGTNTDSLADSLGKTVPAQLNGQTFAMTLSQQVNANGTDNDSIVFESSGQTSNGGYATVSMSTGSSFSSAFASMLNNFQDASPAITDGANTTMAKLGQSADGLGGVFGQLAADLQNSNSDGTASIGEGMLTSSVNLPSAPDSNAPTDGMVSFLSTIIQSLEANLQNPAPNAGSNTDNNNPKNTVA